MNIKMKLWNIGIIQELIKHYNWLHFRIDISHKWLTLYHKVVFKQNKNKNKNKTKKKPFKILYVVLEGFTSIFIYR